jgi:iron uptake system component EfeO
MCDRQVLDISNKTRASAARLVVAVAMTMMVGCGSGSSRSSDAQSEAALTTHVHDSVETDIDKLVQAAADLQSAAPVPDADGWGPATDADAIAQMKAAWIRARTAYERVEGVLAPLFPDVDNSIDARYDDFMDQLAGYGDPNPFDGEGVTGMHAIERILYADVIPPNVVALESHLPGYAPAAFPSNETEASDFKTKLCGKFITDARTLQSDWQPSRIDLGGAFQGLISLVNEQQEKVNKAATGEEESRYSERTLADLEDNLAGTTTIYAFFGSWLVTKSGGPPIDAKIEDGFQTLSALYATFPGATIPEPPATWSSLNPTTTDLATPFGQLYTAVQSAVDPVTNGSIVFEMNLAAVALGFPEFRNTP